MHGLFIRAPYNDTGGQVELVNVAKRLADSSDDLGEGLGLSMQGRDGALAHLVCIDT